MNSQDEYFEIFDKVEKLKNEYNTCVAHVGAEIFDQHRVEKIEVSLNKLSETMNEMFKLLIHMNNHLFPDDAN